MSGRVGSRQGYCANSDQLKIIRRPRLPHPPLGPAFGSLRTPAFRWWFASQVLSASGTMTQAVAQSWLLLKLTGSGLDLGILGSCYMLPILVGGPWAGALVDRVDRRRLLIATQSLFIVAASALAVLTWTGTIQVWMLFVMALLTGAVSAPDGAARQVYVLDLVGGRRLVSAVSLNEVVLNVSRVVGPATGGLLLATLGIPVCYVANALSYVPPLLVLLLHPAHRSLVGLHRRVAAPRGAVRDGLRYVWNTPVLRATVLMAAASGMLFNLGGALLAASGQARPEGRAVRVLCVLTGLSILATAAAPDVAMAFAGLLVTGCLSIWFIARANPLAQLRADPSMRGRVMGIWSMALPGAQPLTSPGVGYAAEAAGARAGFGLAGVALLLTAAAGWRALGERWAAPRTEDHTGLVSPAAGLAEVTPGAPSLDPAATR